MSERNLTENSGEFGSLHDATRGPEAPKQLSAEEIEARLAVIESVMERASKIPILDPRPFGVIRDEISEEGLS